MSGSMAPFSVFLVVPPLTQLNTPYPSTAYLTGFLRSRGVSCHQADLGIEMVLRLFSREGVRAIFDQVRDHKGPLPKEARAMLEAAPAYVKWIEPVIGFLQGGAPALAAELATPGVLPQGPRFAGRARLPRSMPVQDRAKLRATWFLEDLADLVQAVVSPHFALNRYGEHLARAASSFDTLAAGLAEAPSLTDRFMLDALSVHLDRIRPDLVGLSVPFPGNVYGAFRIAQTVRQQHPQAVIALGGGYVNTELRRISDPRIFDYVDFVTLDDGERPLLSLVEHLTGTRPRASLCRTFYRDKGRVCYSSEDTAVDVPMSDVGCPTYDGLALDRYVTVLDSTNPMHRLWSEGHWNKLTVAHGCYWKQCTFCDVGLDYIGRYEATPTDRMIERITDLIDETGRRNFHFVDEAAPPAGLKSLALALLERRMTISWWGNIRFEAAFSPDLCRLLAASGCIAVTAGLEAASDRLLEKMKKGITVDQTVLVCSAFNRAGILVHGYLMYGFPSETLQETIDALERVRQLFAAGLMQSAFWHRFTATAHSPVGLDPDSHGIRISGPRFQGFAENDLTHTDPKGSTPDWVREGLRRSMLNFLEGRGLTMDVGGWFDRKVPRPAVPRTWVRRLVHSRPEPDDATMERRLVWLGGIPTGRPAGKSRRMRLPGKGAAVTVDLPSAEAGWIEGLIALATPKEYKGQAQTYPLLRDAIASFPGGSKRGESFLSSASWETVRNTGLLLV